MCAWSIRRSNRSTSLPHIPIEQVVFFAIGFETTTPATAHVIRRSAAARPAQPQRLLQPCAHARRRSKASLIRLKCATRQVRVDGFIGPSHVSTVIGSRPYEYFAEEYQRPVVIAGFEPLDVMQAIRMLVAAAQ